MTAVQALAWLRAQARVRAREEGRELVLDRDMATAQRALLPAPAQAPPAPRHSCASARRCAASWLARAHCPMPAPSPTL